MLIATELSICDIILIKRRKKQAKVKVVKWMKNRTRAYQARKIKVVKFRNFA